MKFRFFGPGKPSIYAFTGRINKIANELKSPVQVIEAFDPTINPSQTNLRGGRYTAIWDTGATGTAISYKVVSDLGLPEISRAEVHNVDDVTEAGVYLVNLLLPNKVGIFGVPVTDAANIGGGDVLIGMDIITIGDFAVTNYQGKTMFTFRYPSLETMDFAKEISEEKERYNAHISPEGQRRKHARKKSGMQKPKGRK